MRVESYSSLSQNKHTISVFRLISYFAFFLLFSPSSLSMSAGGLLFLINEFFAYAKMLVGFSILVYYFLLVISRRVPCFAILFYSMLSVVLLYSGTVNSNLVNSVKHFGRVYVPMLGMLAFVEIGLIRSPKTFLDVGCRVLKLLCAINTVFVLMLPNGFFVNSLYGRVHFLGPDNGMTIYYFALTLLIGVRSFLYGKKLNHTDILSLVSFCITMLWVFCGMGIICCAFMMAVLVMTLRYRKTGKQMVFMKKQFYWTVYIVLCVTQLVMLLGSSSGIFAQLAEKLLGKGESFDIRMIIWAGALMQIVKSPVYGMGPFAIASTWGKVDWYSHNGYLDVALKSGFVGLGLCVLAQCIAIHAIKKCKNKPLSMFVFFSMVAVLLVAFGEGPFLQPEYMIAFVIAYRLGNSNSTQSRMLA